MRIERQLFAFFLVSGFCSLAYEVIWLRLAMASFGVTTPLVSLVLSVFMGGMAVGSWLGGRIARATLHRGAGAALRFYALTEACIGVSGLVVPYELRYGQRLLAQLGDEVAWGSGAHYLAAGAWITLALLPFCTAMGATFPLGIAALPRASSGSSQRSFSYLYAANVLGAALGTLASAFVLIELLGFRGTGRAAAALNGLLAACAFGASLFAARRSALAESAPAAYATAPTALRGSAEPWLLFATGLLSMAMEVVWVRQFTPWLGTVVYSFASILALYLAATFFGSIAYRRWSRSSSAPGDFAQLGPVWIGAFVFALLPLLCADPRLGPPHAFALGLARMALGIMPFCAAIGFLTPMLVDRWSGGDPRRAGSVYAMNIVGCVIGPLLASFVLLPWLGERWSLVATSAPLAMIGVLAMRTAGQRIAAYRSVILASAGVLAATLVLATRDYETAFRRREVRRDYAATVIATGTDFERLLVVNGEGITVLTSVTKLMAHLPLAHLPRPAQRVLVICFGMGTSFRSSVSWGVPTTAVELIPSVPAFFSYFHADAARVLAAPGARIVVDDGRRFLERSVERFDVVTIDPPPPVEAAGSSLLYSREFYDVIKAHLAPGGIVHQWLPGGGEPAILVSVTKALRESFPYVRAFRSIIDSGIHYLVSMEPIPKLDAAALASRLPPDATRDLVEWVPLAPADVFATMLRNELEVSQLASIPGISAIEDDRPINEYYFLRRLSGARGQQPSASDPSESVARGM